MSARRSAKLGLDAYRRHLGRSRRSRRWRRRAFRRDHHGDPRRRARDDDRGADAGFPEQGRRARSGRRGQARCLQPQSRNRAAALCRACGRARAISTRCACSTRSKRLDPAMFTKSGIMVGLGEDKSEVLQVMDDLRAAQVDFLTIGQYLQPTPKHHAVDRFVDAGRIRNLSQAPGARQGLPDGLGLAADPLLLSRRRRFREARAPRAMRN